MARFAAGFFARSVNFGPHYEPTDIIATEVVLLPERAGLISRLLADLEKMRPSSGLADDHIILVRYFEGLSENIKAQGAALDAQDIAAYLNVGAEGRVKYCDARAGLSQDMAQIAGMYFSDLLGGCRTASSR